MLLVSFLFFQSSCCFREELSKKLMEKRYLISKSSNSSKFIINANNKANLVQSNSFNHNIRILEADYTGNCGTDVTFSFSYDTSTLTIEGAGNMNDYGEHDFPFSSFQPYVKTIIIADEVIKIGRNAFQKFENLEKVTIGNGVTTIENYAFRDCFKLITVKIGSKVGEIRSDSFLNCNSLQSYIVNEDNPKFVSQNGIIYLKDYSSLQFVPQAIAGNILLNENLISIEKETFLDCKLIRSLTIPAKVAKINSGAFTGCSRIQEFIVDKNNQNYKSINGILFTYDEAEIIAYPVFNSNTTYEIPKTVKIIGDGAFSGCLSFTSIIIPDTVTIIGEEAFSYCSNLVSVTFGNSLTNIEGYAFMHCSSIETINFPDSVQIVSYDSFASCSSLTTVTIGSGLTKIYTDTFSECNKLQSIVVSENNKNYSSFNGILYQKDFSEIEFVPYGISGDITLHDELPALGDSTFDSCTLIRSITIKDKITEISQYAFLNCGGLEEFIVSPTNEYFKSIDGVLHSKDETKILFYPPAKNVTYYEILNTVTEICMNSFYKCIHLTSIAMPNSVITIGGSAFKNCYNLKEIEISSEATTLGFYAFQSCISLELITIPDKITSIGYDTFTNCSSLTTVTIGSALNSISEHAFDDCINLKSFFVNDNNMDFVTQNGIIYKKDYSSIEFVPLAITGDISLNSNLISIKDHAFENCHSLKTISIKDKLETIGTDAFNGCSSLVSLTVDENNPNFASNNGIIYSKTFEYIEVIPQGISGDISLHENLLSIKRNAFYNCKELKSVVIPNKVKIIEVFSFSECTNLSTVTIGSEVTNINAYAFYRCNSLQTITIPDKVTTIRYKAFADCNSITTITIGSAVNSISENAFDDSKNLNSFIVNEKNSKFITENGIIYKKDYSSVEFVPFAIKGDVSLNSNLISIKDRAFENCHSIKTISIKDKLETIGTDVFIGCNSLVAINVDENNAKYKSVNGILYNKDGTVLIHYPAAKSDTTFEIPKSMTEIKPSTFKDVEKLLSIVIPETITEISSLAFSDCKSLTEFVVFDNNTFFASLNGVLYSKPRITRKSIDSELNSLLCYPSGKTESSYSIPDNVKSIESYAFSHCNNLESIVIGNNIESIGKFAFSDCQKLKTISFKGINEPQFAEPMFSNCNEVNRINVLPEYKGNTFCLLPIDKGTLPLPPEQPTDDNEDNSSNDNENPEPGETPKEKGNSKTAIIAGTVSAAVIVVIAVVATVICYFKKVACFGQKDGQSTSEGKDPNEEI